MKRKVYEKINKNLEILMIYKRRESSIRLSFRFYGENISVKVRRFPDDHLIRMTRKVERSDTYVWIGYDLKWSTVK